MEILNQIQGKENIYTTSQVYAYIQENLWKEKTTMAKNLYTQLQRYTRQLK